MRRLGKVGMLFLVAVLAVGAITAAGAYFSDVETAESASLTSGSLDMVIADSNEGWKNGNPVHTWNSPSNWSPGQTVIDTVYLKNIGNVNAKWLWLDFKSLGWGSSSLTEPEAATGNPTNKLCEAVIVEKLRFYKDGAWLDLTDYYTDVFGGPDGVYTLNELVNPSEAGGWCTYDGYGAMFWAEGGVDVLTGDFRVEMTLKFDEAAGNAYQTDYCSFVVDAKIFNDKPAEYTEGGEGCSYGYGR